MEKNKLLLNEYLGDFMHFETIFFLQKMNFSNPPNPTKVRKIPQFFFETFPYRDVSEDHTYDTIEFNEFLQMMSKQSNKELTPKDIIEAFQ